MKKIIAFLLSFLVVFSLCSCKKSDEKSAENPTSVSTENTVKYEEKGQGQNQFYLDIFFESSEKHYNIKTDKATVGEALEELEIIVGEEGPYGLYISSVEGEEHVYENGGKYWAFYEDGQYASKGIDLTEAENGKTYSLKVE